MRILIVEDEQIIAQRLSRMVRDILGSEIVSLRHEAYFSDASRYLERHAIDLLILDLNLNGADGFDILSQAVSQSFQTIIVSAHADQAIRAFEFGVIDFVTKPWTEQRLRQAIERTRNLRVSGRTTFLAIRSGHRMDMIAVSEILYIKGADDYSEIHCQDGSTYLHDKTLTQLQQLLPANFQRLHRSYLVNLKFVCGHEHHGGGRYSVILQNGEKLQVSRTKVQFLRTLAH